jgi:very-short-patch-repair endonuclease
MQAPILTVKRARALRRKMTLPEVLLWQKLRGGQLEGLKFRRQHPLGPYILDFFCSSAWLAIEVDSAAHDAKHRLRHDRRRDRWLNEQNIKVLRIAAADILRDDSFPHVLTAIARAAAPSTASGGPPPP